GLSANAVSRGTYWRQGLTRRFHQIGFVLPNASLPLAQPALAPGRRQIGFDLPNSAKLGGGGDGAPRIACPAKIGFVLPKPAQPGGGSHGAPRIAPPRRRGRQPHRIECPDRRLAP